MRAIDRNIAVVALLLPAVILPGCNSAAQAGSAPPIRVVRVGRPAIAPMKEVIAEMWTLCKAGISGRLVTESPPLPSDEYFSSFRAEETEELFDGKNKARYRTSRVISPDPKRDCALTIFIERVASIEHACRHRILGSTTPVVEFAPSGTPATFEIDEEEAECFKAGPGAPEQVAGVPSESAGSTRCIWQSKLLFPESARTTPPSSEERNRETDVCLYARLPTYPFGDSRYPVILKVWQPPQLSSTAPQIPKFSMAHLVLEEEPIAFSDGDPIPPQRFTRVALESFLRQPSRMAVERSR
jgi:hypothetical protein